MPEVHRELAKLLPKLGLGFRYLDPWSLPRMYHAKINFIHSPHRWHDLPGVCELDPKGTVRTRWRHGI